MNILKGESRPVDFIECETREARWMVMVFLMVAKIMITVSVVIITMLIIIYCGISRTKVTLVFGVKLLTLSKSGSCQFLELPGDSSPRLTLEARFVTNLSSLKSYICEYF